MGLHRFVRGPRFRRPVLAILCLAAWASCGKKGQSPQAAGADSPAFVVFTEDRLTLSRLESPTAAPVALGSTPSDATMGSDDPSVVSIAQDGKLVAHKNGETVIRPRGGGTSRPLHVEVRAVTAIHLEPDHAQLNSDERIEVRLLGQDGKPIDPTAAQWSSSTIGVGFFDAPKIRAGLVKGHTTITAKYGDLTAKFELTVGEEARLAFVSPPHRVHVGSTTRLDLSVPQGPDIEWSARPNSILKSIGNGFFWAPHRGQAKACARRGSQSICTNIEVVR